MRKHIGDQKVAAAGADDHSALRQPVQREHALQLPGELAHLAGAPGRSEGEPLGGRAVARVEADHPREAPVARRCVFGGVVGGGVEVVRRVQLTGEAVHIGHGREVLVHHVEPLAAPFNAWRERTQGRAHHALVDQFAAGQALRIRARGGQHAAALERDQVGGGAADVDQHTAAVHGRAARGMLRGREPVGRGDVGPVARHGAAVAPAGITGEELDRLLRREPV